ncbi:MAG: thiamine-monophosphate kinase [Deltaproteobacteria bacterium]|nr:thiamine-monophosphate kinase [Deltaproteobacteria bacterium]
MLSEKDIIETINRCIPSDANRETACFESDAERLKFNGNKILLSTDEFSSEDKFPETDPFSLGWNIAAGTISDVLATGGIPLYYSHALTVSHNWSRKYLEQFCHGVRDVLKEYQVSFAGGDTGSSDQYRCTSTVIGKTSERDISRKGIKSGDLIYLSGKVGAGNYNAAINIFCKESKFKSIVELVASNFKLRKREAKFIQKYATACIDTSDGVFNALNSVAVLNNNGYIVDKLPYIKMGIITSKLLSLPKELLLLGECGEYELLFFIKSEDEKEFLEKSTKEKLDFYCLGQVLEDPKERTIISGKRKLNMSNFNISARDFINLKDYLKKLTDWIKK